MADVYRADIVGSQNAIFPPYPSTASTFTRGAFFGITIQAGIPRQAAAQATAAAWFPLDWVTIPR